MLSGFSVREFSHEGLRYPVFRAGTGPGVVIMHEIPGITPQVASFARRVADEGFSVALPEMFGTTGRDLSGPYAGREILRACIRREFHVLAARGSSPITIWLRALCRDLHAEVGGVGVGALGMCLTGNFALALMVDASVMAPVLSQPSLPFPVGSARRSALHISDGDLEKVRQRVRSQGQKLLGLRFTRDPMCPPERFSRLRSELGEGFEGIEIDSSPGNPHGIPKTAHSVLTTDLVDVAGHPTREALDRVLGFFRERLCTEAGA